MKYLSTLSIFLVLLLMSCKNDSQTDSQTEKGPTIKLTEEDIVQMQDATIVDPEYEGDDAGYVSMVEFFEDQWEFRKGQPYTLQRIVEENGQVDSSFVGLDEKLWKEMIQPFLDADINDPQFKGAYTFEIIEETTQPKYYFNYQAKYPHLEVKNTQLTLDSYTNRVEAVYIEKAYKRNDIQTIQKLLYLVGRQFQVHTIKYRDGKEISNHNIKHLFKF